VICRCGNDCRCENNNPDLDHKSSSFSLRNPSQQLQTNSAVTSVQKHTIPAANAMVMAMVMMTSHKNRGG
jgi:hypothetical protein